MSRNDVFVAAIVASECIFASIFQSVQSNGTSFPIEWRGRKRFFINFIRNVNSPGNKHNTFVRMDIRFIWKLEKNYWFDWFDLHCIEGHWTHSQASSILFALYPIFRCRFNFVYNLFAAGITRNRKSNMKTILKTEMKTYLLSWGSSLAQCRVPIESSDWFLFVWVHEIANYNYFVSHQRQQNRDKMCAKRGTHGLLDM